MRRLGWIPDTPDARDYGAEKFGLARDLSALPEEVSLEQHVGEVYDQSTTNSCVGWAFCNAIEIAERAAGLAEDRLSVLYPYFYARMADDPTARFVLDDGCRPRNLIKVAFRLGVPDDEHWPWEPGKLWMRKNRRPSFNADMQAHGRRGGEYARIGTIGLERVRDVRAALAGGYPVMIALRITEEFADAEGPLIVDVPRIGGPFVGGHMVTLVGYEPDRNRPGQYLYRVLNSYGEDWKDGGLCWITEDYLTSAYCSDRYICRAWERIRKARELQSTTSTGPVPPAVVTSS